MKTILVISVAVLLLLAGFYDSMKQKKKTSAFGEMVDFARFVKSEVQYRVTDSETLATKINGENFRYIKQKDDGFFATDIRDEKAREQFQNFVNHLGTTDKEGQLNLCDEYIEKFSELLNEHKQNEKSKIQINTALSVFGALSIVILFI